MHYNFVEHARDSWVHHLTNKDLGYHGPAGAGLDEVLVEGRFIFVLALEDSAKVFEGVDRFKWGICGSINILVYATVRHWLTLAVDDNGVVAQHG